MHGVVEAFWALGKKLLRSPGHFNGEYSGHHVI
jgi:hypothetical protein